jgi:hypothetical protein
LSGEALLPTATDDKVGRRLEVRAPLASRRLRTLAELTAAGSPAYAFADPLLPHFAIQPELLDDLFGRLVDAVDVAIAIAGAVGGPASGIVVAFASYPLLAVLCGVLASVAAPAAVVAARRGSACA